MTLFNPYSLELTNNSGLTNVVFRPDFNISFNLAFKNNVSLSNGLLSTSVGNNGVGYYEFSMVYYITAIDYGKFLSLVNGSLASIRQGSGSNLRMTFPLRLALADKPEDFALGTISHYSYQTIMITNHSAELLEPQFYTLNVSGRTLTA